MTEKEDIGPQLPPHLLKREYTNEVSNEETYQNTKCVTPEAVVEQVFGPALPPGMAPPEKNKNEKVSVGPALPPGWKRSNESDSSSESDIDENEDFIGPAPNTGSNHDDGFQRKLEIEARAIAMKEKLSGKHKEVAPKREAWMTELPPELGANIGIVARTFKKRTLNSKDADRSVWTDTPADRERKLKERREQKGKSDEKISAPSKKDIEMNERVQEHNKQYRASSLMEMHKEERKKKKEDESTERRAFDRTQDLDFKKVDKKAVTSFIKSSKNLNTKFENSKLNSKFL